MVEKPSTELVPSPAAFFAWSFAVVDTVTVTTHPRETVPRQPSTSETTNAT